MTNKQRVAKLNAAKAQLRKTTRGYTPTGVYWREAFALLDQLADDLSVPPAPKVPQLGPVVRGGKPILEQDLTHITGGLTAGGSVWPAFDEAIGRPGLTVIAPEAVTVTGHGRARRRDGNPNGQSINLAVGASGIEYWFGHLENLAPVGAKVKKGGRLGTISPNHEAPHVHVGINAKPLIGRDLDHHANYTHGATKVGLDLARALSA